MDLFFAQKTYEIFLEVPRRLRRRGTGRGIRALMSLAAGHKRCAALFLAWRCEALAASGMSTAPEGSDQALVLGGEAAGEP